MTTESEEGSVDTTCVYNITVVNIPNGVWRAVCDKDCDYYVEISTGLENEGEGIQRIDEVTQNSPRSLAEHFRYFSTVCVISRRCSEGFVKYPEKKTVISNSQSEMFGLETCQN